MMATMLDSDRLSILTDLQLKEMAVRDFLRFVSSMSTTATSGGTRSLSNAIDLRRAFDDFKPRNPRSLSLDRLDRSMEVLAKAAVNFGTTLEPAWAAALAAVRPFNQAFVDVARAASLVGKLLPVANRVPFNVSVPVATSGGTYKWAGQGAPMPVGNMQLAGVTLPIAKAGGLIILSEELVKLTAPGSDAVMEREMKRGLAKYLDEQFTDPTVVAVAGTSPASITNGAPSIASAGSSAANAATDIKNLIATFTATNPDAASMALLMSPAVATSMAVATNSTTLGPDGGRLYGVPVYTGTIGNRIIVLDPSALLIADDGDLDVTVARHATVEMETTATSPPTASTAYISLWQLNLVGLKVERVINWRMARANSVLYTNVAYV